MNEKYIYLHYLSESDTPFYVGQGINCRYKDNKRNQEWYNEVGDREYYEYEEGKPIPDNTWYSIIIYSGLDEELANKLEIEEIEKWGRRIDGGILVNIQNGGNSSLLGLRWINNGIETKIVTVEQLDEYLNNGWVLNTEEWYENNKDKILDNMKEYYEKNKDKIKEYKKEYYENNKEKILEKDKEYREKNKDKIKEYKKEFYENNKEKILEKDKEYYEKNKDKKKEKMKEYYEKNKDKIKEYREKNKDKIKEYYEKNKEKMKEYYEKNKDKRKEYRRLYYKNNKK